MITTVFDPFSFYRKQVEETDQTIDNFKQLLRRLETIHYHYINKNGEYKEYVIPAAQFKSGADMIAESQIYSAHEKEFEALKGTNETPCDISKIIEMFDMKPIK